MTAKYDTDYFVNAKFSPYVTYPKSNMKGVDVIATLEARAEVIANSFPQGTTVIDWGCATGILVNKLNEIGIAAIGYDFADWAIANRVSSKVHQVNALEVYEDDIHEVELMHSCDFLEHIGEEDIYLLLLKMSRRCKKAMWHYVPFYPSLDKPVIGGGEIHLIQVNSAWWKNLFESIPGFKIVEFPLATHGGYIKLERIDKLEE